MISRKIILTAFLLFSVLAAPTFSSESYVVLADKINVRIDSTTQSLSLGLLSKNDKVQVVKSLYEWRQIILPKQFRAYVWSEYVKKISLRKGEVTASKLNLRTKPSLDSPTIGKLEQGDVISILAKDGEWLKVVAYPYSKGWVHKKFLAPVDLASQNSAGKKDLPLKIKDEEIGLSSFVGNVMPRLSRGTLKAKRKIEAELISKGPNVVTLLESHLDTANNSAVYSIINVFAELGKSNRQLVSYFFKKSKSTSLRNASIYLDVIGSILDSKEAKKPFFYLATNNDLTISEANEARSVFEKQYHDLISKDMVSKNTEPKQ